ncbi:MAG: tRNA (adenosine(37)-N6)-threonylcarbamoyltransferase complex dimerization subunit type 1 TsaB [Pseudomonadota bacterium]
MRLIAFDTATEWCTAALWQDGRVTYREVHAGQRHSDLLVPMIQDLLAEAGLGLRDLDGLAYGMGPGSFTGLRIACGVAQGLALGADLPVLGVSTLETLAAEALAAQGAEQVMACLDARMQEVYVGLYRFEGGAWLCASGPRVCPPEQTPRPEGGLWTGIGSGFAAYPALADRVGRCLPAGIPHARSLVALAAPRFSRGEGVPAEQAEPLYIRDKVALKICER